MSAVSDLKLQMNHVARALLGEPNTRLGDKCNLRFGTRGSLRVCVEGEHAGTWHDYESNQGGGVLALIERETGLTSSAAFQWLEDQGLRQGMEFNSKGIRPKIVATYDYLSHTGDLLFQVCRMHPKGFRQRRPDKMARGGFSWSVNGVQQVPYRLPSIVATKEIIFIVEGEKDANALAERGLIATCNAGGANKWPDALTPWFRGRDVVILPDNDEAGRAHAAMVVSKLSATASSVRVLDLAKHWSTMPPKGDVADWLDAGHSEAELLGLAASAPHWPATYHGGKPGIIGLDIPLPSPESVYHPQQIDWQKSKEPGEVAFRGARGTAENLARLVRAYGVRIRYNELSREVEISVNGKLPVGDLARSERLSLVEDLCRINGYPYTAVAGHLDRLAARDSHNPAFDWIVSRAWDGGEHIRRLFNCLTLADPSSEAISWKLFRKWVLGAAAILTGKARKFEHVLVLVDPHGGIGKTRFFNTLCPKEFQSDGVTLNPDDKDSVLQVVSKWLVELGEIGATFSKSDIESLKAFLTRDTDELRPAYARAANRYQRRTAFFGSVNNVRFLVDDTNNRRFWPIEVSAIDYRHGIDMQQLWAEALHQVEAGETWHLNPNENRMIGEHNEGFRSMDRVEECILTMYDAGALPCRHLSASQVLQEIGVLGAKTGEMRRAGTILRKVFAHVKRNNVVMYHMPFPLSRLRHLTPVRTESADGPL